MKALATIVCILIAMFMLFLCGCSTTSSTASKIGQDIGVVSKKVCNFDVNTSQEAKLGIAFISTAAGVVGPIYGVPITAAEAEIVLNQVVNASSTGACVLLTDLENAMAYYNALATQYQAKNAGKKGVKEPPLMLNLMARIQAAKSMQVGK